MHHRFSRQIRVGDTGAGKQQSQKIIHLRNRAYGGAGVLAGGLLVYGDNGAQAGDLIHVRPLHLSDESAGIGRESLHVPPLAFCKDRVERQRTLPAAAQTGDHRQFLARHGHADILQVMHPCPDHFYFAVIFHLPKFVQSYCFFLTYARKSTKKIGEEMPFVPGELPWGER